MDLSIIIPIYNTNIDDFKKCLGSIIKLKNIEYEIIIIDDGSKSDNSAKYASLIKELNLKNIKYYKQENFGVSIARNLGVKKSRGKYIMFIDSDDEIAADVIDNNILKNKYDIIVYNLVIVGRKKIKVVKPIDDSYGIIDPNKILRDLVTKCKFYSPCAKLIKKEMLELNKVNFNANIIHGEDAIFNIDMLKTNPKIYYTDKNLYLYKYIFNTSSSRWKNNTLKMIRSIVYLHNCKMALKNQLQLTSFELYKINQDTVKKIFIGSMELSNCKDKFKGFKLLVDELKKLKIENKHLNKISKLKYRLMLNQNIKIISFLTIIRRFYLKLK